MTDMERWKELLTACKVPFEEDTAEVGKEQRGSKILTVRVPDAVIDATVEGWHSFFTCIEFDDAGKFVVFGIWE